LDHLSRPTRHRSYLSGTQFDPFVQTLSGDFIEDFVKEACMVQIFTLDEAQDQKDDFCWEVHCGERSDVMIDQADHDPGLFGCHPQIKLLEPCSEPPTTT